MEQAAIRIIGVDPGHCRPGRVSFAITWRRLHRLILFVVPTIKEDGRRVFRFFEPEVAIPRILFADILQLVSELRPPPPVAST
jgi:hypothetical protein